MASSLETNKTLAALLTAGIIASGSGVISRMLYHPSMPEENAYVVAAPEATTGGGEAGGEAEAAPLPVLLAKADPGKGATIAKKCAACHSEEKGGPVKIGPPLWGVVGRDIAAVEGFDYSEALHSKEGEWTFDNLFEFIHSPREWAPGTKMTFAGIKKPEDRADLLVYLRTLSDQPVPLPEAPAEAATATEQGAGAAGGAEQGAGQAAAPAEPAAAAAPSTEQAAPASQQAVVGEPGAAGGQAAPAGAAPAGAAASGGEDGIGARLAHADADAGAKDARKCAACHSFEEGGKAKIGPPLWGVVGRDIAAVDGFSYSDAMTQKEGAWDYQKLDAFLTKPREWAPGTKMAFAGIAKPEERADVILYLRSLSDNPAPLP
jgi:cytochrome c